jgi:hypothetical protein
MLSRSELALPLSLHTLPSLMPHMLPGHRARAVLRPVVRWNFSTCLSLCIVANLYDVVRAL